MAVTKITFENKTGIQNDASVARKNKVVDEDMNEIKQVVNNNADEVAEIQENIEDLQGGQGTADADITSLKNRVNTLETDNTQNKSDINILKNDNETNKSNIEELQEDNIQNKADITDIKEEQETQNEKINTSITKNEAQDELISKLKNALINAETEEAKSIHVEDASTIGQLEVFGNQEQETVKGIQILQNTNQGNTGYNFFTNPTGVGKVEEIDFLGTKGAKFSLTEKLTSWKYITRNTNLSKLKNNTTYTIQFDCKTNYNESALMIRIQFGDTSNTFLSFPTETVNNETKRIKLVATSNDTALNAQILYIQPNALNDVGEEFSITNLILVEGDYSNTELEWEDYTDLEGSPSPNHPSEVVCLGSNVKNIFTETNVLSDVYLNNFDEIVENQDYVMYYFEVEPNQNYVLSFKYTQNLVELGKIGYGFSDSVPFIGQELEAEDTYSIFGNKVNGKVIIPSKKYLIFNFMKSMYNTMYDIQLEKGTEATSYSPPGQGSTKISKINKNLFNGSDVYNGYITGTAGQKISYQSSSLSKTYKNCCKLIKDKNYTLSFNKNNPTNTNTKICAIVDEDENILQMFNLNPTQEAALITSNQTGYLYLVTDVNATNIQIEGGTIATDYIEHQQEDYILYIQQEMLKGDYFVKEDDGWKEVHGFGKYVFDGTENYIKSPLSDDDYLKTYTNTPIISEEEIKFDGKMFATRYKNIGIYSSSTTDNRIACRSQLHTQISTEFLTENTAEAYKALLAEWKNEGKPLVVFYELISPTKLACTEEQSAVLEKINNLDLFEDVNNIITTEDIALLKLKYALDVKTYIDNKLKTTNQEKVTEEE